MTVNFETAQTQLHGTSAYNAIEYKYNYIMNSDIIMTKSDEENLLYGNQIRI